jgi:hypothetical protein
MSHHALIEISTTVSRGGTYHEQRKAYIHYITGLMFEHLQRQDPLSRVNLVLLAQTIIEILLKVALNTNKSINYIQIT